MKNKGAQVTIFIIAAIVIVAIVLLFIAFRKDIVPSGGGHDEVSSPQSFLQTCIKDSVYKGIEVIGENGGYINPEFSINFLFTETSKRVNISYLCYTDQNETNCMQQEPMLFEKVEGELKKYIKDDVKNCWESLENSLTKEGYLVQVKHSEENYDVEIKRNEINVKINKEITVTKNNETRTEKDFLIKIPSKIYEIIMYPVQEILTVETTTRSCEFDVPRYELLYPRFDINVSRVEGGIKVYFIEQEQTKEIFRFATRSCASPGRGPIW